MLTGFNPETITDLEGARNAIRMLLNLIEEIKSEDEALRTEIASLRDEIQRLKGEQGRPDIKPNKKNKQGAEHSSEKERHRPKKWRKGKKNHQLRIDRVEHLRLTAEDLPADAVFKGTTETLIQDLRISTDNICFVRQKYYSPSQRRVFTAPLPKGYSGQFGPGVRALVLTLYTAGGMSEAKIAEFLAQFGIMISSGQLSNLLIKQQEGWHREKDAIWRAGLASTNFQHIDDTATRVDGENWSCHVLCNPFYTAYFTRPRKDRLTVIELLQGTKTMQFLLTERTSEWLQHFKTPHWAQRKIAQWPQNQLLARSQLRGLLSRDVARLNLQQQARILEAAALSAYHAQSSSPIIPILVSDDAAQFQYLTKQQALCWIHEGRHYKKLTPFLELHRHKLEDFLGDFWEFYRELRGYQQAPTKVVVERLRARFDELFTTVTGFEMLDKRIAKTHAKRERLLVGLEFPEVPLHNNPAELGVRQRVRKRDVSFGPRSPDGVAAWDSFMTLTETAKKLGVSFYAYAFDRVTQAYLLPSLAHLIVQHSDRAGRGAVQALGP